LRSRGVQQSVAEKATSAHRVVRWAQRYLGRASA
jgi:hypothetical protein